MTKQASRGTEIDTEKCVENAGGRFNLVIMAAARSREIRRQHHSSLKFEHVHSNVTALLEFQTGELDHTYMSKIQFKESRNVDRGAKYSGR